MSRVLSENEREKLEVRFAEDAWLNYFNRYLFEQGTISEKEYKKMTEKIALYKKGFKQSIKNPLFTIHFYFLLRHNNIRDAK